MNVLKVKWWWEYIQGLLDVNGDVVMLAFSAAVIWKIVHGGMTAADSAVYASAVGAFAYSNKGPKQ